MLNQEEYINKVHKWGKIWALAAGLTIIAFPFVLAIIYGEWPNFGTFLKGLGSVAVTYWPIGLIEVFTYTPLLGVGGTYLGFITGNLSSLKVPCAMTCMDEAGVKAESEEGEIISTISIAVSSIVTILIIAIGVCLIVPLYGFLTSEAIKPAFDNVLPSLFGALAVVYLSRNFKIAIPPMVLMLLLFIFVPGLTSSLVGIMIPVGIIITVIYARILYKKGKL